MVLPVDRYKNGEVSLPVRPDDQNMLVYLMIGSRATFFGRVSSGVGATVGEGLTVTLAASIATEFPRTTFGVDHVPGR